MGVSGSGELGGDTTVEGGRGVGDGSSLGVNAGRLITGGVVGSFLGGEVDGFGGGVLVLMGVGTWGPHHHYPHSYCHCH